MRRFFAAFFAILMLLAPAALAQADLMAATDALFAALDTVLADRNTEGVEFVEAGAWMSAIARQKSVQYTQWFTANYDMMSGSLVAWDDVFTDGEAAAARIAEIAEAFTYDNAYAEHREIRPVPRDSFIIEEDQFFVYYPPEQLSYFSGRAGAFAFYAYELDGLWQEGVPIAQGDVADAQTALADALETGALPGMLSRWHLGLDMQTAADTLTLVDVPDLTDEYALWQFEAPEMRGVYLLSAKDDDQVSTASIAGIHTRRIDFSGLKTGISTEADCVAALGMPDDTAAISGEASAYALHPAGTQQTWTANGHELVLHFVDGVLYSITLLQGQ